MSNTIDIELKRENNSIDSLNYLWQAELNNGKIIAQLDAGIEHKFQEVKDNFKDLIAFKLMSRKNLNDTYTVDLINGIIYHSNTKITESSSKTNIRLIFFRRHQVEMNENNIEKSHKIVYFFGMQYLDDNNSNKQITLEIKNE